MCSALCTQPSVPGFHLSGSCLGWLESVSRDASIFHRQGVRRGLLVGLGTARDGVLRAHVVEVDKGSIRNGLRVLNGEDLLVDVLESK